MARIRLVGDEAVALEQIGDALNALPGGRLAVLRVPDGNLIGLTQQAG